MGVRKIKRKHYVRQKIRYQKRVHSMKFIQVNSTLYPFSDRIVFSVKELPNGSSSLNFSYTDGVIGEVRLCDVTNDKGRPLNEIVSRALVGKVFEIPY